MRYGRYSLQRMPPYLMRGDDGLRMIEILFIYQLARNPVQAIARRWWCRGLFRASRGKRRCPECTHS